MIILDENKYAESLLQNGLAESSPYAALSLLARYYYHTLSHTKKNVKKELINFLQKRYPRYEFDRYDWMEYIDKLIKKVQRLPSPFVTTGVKITKSEMERIRSIKNDTLERLCFTMLCLAKINNQKNPENNGWVNFEDKEIFKMARINCKSTERDIKIGKLQRLGLLEFPKKNDNLNCRITFINNSDDEELFVFDFRELGWEYRSYRGENFIRCAECGILMRSNPQGNKKYCKNCAAYSPIITKEIKCVDCGKMIEVSSKDMRTCRCQECKRTYKNAYHRDYMRMVRNNG